MNTIREYIFVVKCVLLAYINYVKQLVFYKKQKTYANNNLDAIVHINTSDKGGGAARIAYDIFSFQQKQGNDSYMLVADKKTQHKQVFEFEGNKSRTQSMLTFAQKYLQWQDFFHLSSIRIIEHQVVQKASIIHLHNLHSWNGFFSPFALVQLSNQKRLLWTLHDMQAVTGHCAHSFDCKKWQIGCGNCPYLDIYPKLTKDTTSFIWKTKNAIYKKCNMHIVVPSKWLQDIVSQSILSHLPCTLIYNGIDTSIYKPNNKKTVRAAFGLPQEKNIILFSADLGISNPFKGGVYMQQLISKYELNTDILFVNIGGGSEICKKNNVWSIPYIQNENEMAQWYSAADIYVYPSLADNCPLVVLEAMACGLPIVTFNTGGIPELVLHNKTGYVANYKDFDDLCKGFDFIRNNIETRKSMVEESIERVQRYFTLDKMNEQYYNLYKKLV